MTMARSASVSEVLDTLFKSKWRELGMTEIIDDVVFVRAPIDHDGASDLIGRLRTCRRWSPP